MKGLTISTAHAAVVKNAPVKYNLDIKGISVYLYDVTNNNRYPVKKYIRYGIDLKHNKNTSAEKNKLTKT